MFRIGYNTNGLAHHRLIDALELLAELGYEGVAITPDVGQLDPYALDPAEVRAVRDRARDLGLTLTVETGARYVMDARRKHFPTLLEPGERDRARRIDFLGRCAALASDLDADVVSIWAGAAPDGAVADARAPEPGRPPDGPGPDEPGREALWERLVAGVRVVLERCRRYGVRLAFEPEPGMFVERPAGYRELRERLGPDGADVGLCLDVGHLLVTGDVPVGDQIRALGPYLVQVHLDDIAGGVHEHRPFGSGDLDLREALNALLETGYSGMAAVELSRDSHRGALAAEEALTAIREALVRASPGTT